MTARFSPRIFLLGFFVFIIGGWIWFRNAGKPPEVLPETSPNIPQDREHPEISPEFRLENVWKQAFQPDSKPSPTWDEVLAARVYATPQAKANYLRLIEEFGFRGAQAVPYLKGLLQDPDQEIRRAALRALGRTETAEAEAVLLSYARDGVAIEESTEAALVLGQMADPAVTGKLQELYGQSQNSVLREHLVDALASRPWEQTQPFFSSQLRNPNVPAEEKQNALAMLGMRDTAPAFVLTDALGDTREEVRAGAYQGLAWRNETSESQKVRTALVRETDTGVRSMGYEAWGNQMDANRNEILAEYRKERSPEVRLRALKAWASAYGRNPPGNEPFLGEAVATLEQVAMTDRDPGERKEAVQALQASKSTESRDALRRIADKNSNRHIRELANRLSLSGY